MSHSLRSLLQEENTLCIWNNATSICIPDVIGNVPNEEVVQERNYVAVCRAEETREGCEKQSKCLWFGDRCTTDITILNGKCFDASWNVVRRSMQCGLLGTKAKCDILPGCEWDNATGACFPDEKARDEALEANETVRQDFATHQDCANRTAPEPCDAPCAVAGGRCAFPAFFDSERYIVASETSPYCGFHGQILKCVKKRPEDCLADPACLPTPVSCAMSNEALVNITFAKHPKQQKKILNAIEQCPAMATAEECLEFN